MRAWEALVLAVALLVTTAPAAAGQGTTTEDWGTRQALGDTAVALTVDLSSPAECSFEVRMGGSVHPQGGPLSLMYLEHGTEVLGSGVTSVMPSYSAHLGPIDTRPGIDVAGQATLLPAGEWGSTSSVSGPMPAGTLVFTVGGLDLHSTGEEPGDLGYQALGVTVTCQAPFEVTATQASHELLTFNGQSMQDGAGAFASLVLGASVGDSVERSFTTSAVHSRVSWREYQDHAQVGQLDRTTPDGTTTYDLDATGSHRIRDTTGPGLHRYELDRVGLDFFSTLTGVVYGLDAIDGLGDLLGP